MSQPDGRTWYLARGGIPTRADEWSSKDPPDWWCREGDESWQDFDPDNPASRWIDRGDTKPRKKVKK
jgi:hypothetical protein